MKLRLEGSRPEAGNATTFIFSSAEPLHWVAGQSIKIAVPGIYGPIERRFSISSAPSEGHIAITTRPSDSEFKSSLFSLTPGAIVDAYSIEGDFIWRDHPEPLIFVAAGIGITPFRAMLQERTIHRLPVNATLIYGTHIDDIIFNDELIAWASMHPTLTLRTIVGERLTAETIAQETNLVNRLVYIAGPSSMVDTLTASLLAAGHPQEAIVRDWFTGRLPEADLQ